VGWHGGLSRDRVVDSRSMISTGGGWGVADRMCQLEGEWGEGGRGGEGKKVRMGDWKWVF